MPEQVERRDAVVRIDVSVYRFPLEVPVATSFGLMKNRPAVFVRLEAGDGAFGWGEIFANWPAAGAEHRARLLVEDISDLVLGQKTADPARVFAHLESATHVRALQCGEWGPFRQVVAGVDTALHDLVARRAGLPVAVHLNAAARAQVPAYASGIHVKDASVAVPRSRAQGFHAFKVKVGFDLEHDIIRTKEAAQLLEEGEQLFVDANQAWNPTQAQRYCTRVASDRIGWLEEPLPADAPAEHWSELASRCTIPLAAGENIATARDFDAAIRAGLLSVIQPDIAKWGGFSGCLPVALRILASDRLFCPHFLGGGVGLLASAHLLAAAGGPGLLEVDVNPNPLRDAFVDFGNCITAAGFAISAEPGLGIEGIPAELSSLKTLELSCKR